MSSAMGQKVCVVNTVKVRERLLKNIACLCWHKCLKQ